jgi:hypothetical protein
MATRNNDGPSSDGKVFGIFVGIVVLLSLLG